jgi:hypothetical protein
MKKEWEVEIKGKDNSGTTWFLCQSRPEAEYWKNDVLRMGGEAVIYPKRPKSMDWKKTI